MCWRLCTWIFLNYFNFAIWDLTSNSHLTKRIKSEFSQSSARQDLSHVSYRKINPLTSPFLAGCRQFAWGHLLQEIRPLKRIACSAFCLNKVINPLQLYIWFQIKCWQNKKICFCLVLLTFEALRLAVDRSQYL